MKILFLTKYTDLGPSSRMRTFQYLQYYKDAGIEYAVQPFFNDLYLKGFYNGKRNYVNVVFCYLKRLALFFTVIKYDKIYIEKELFPYFPSIFESLLSFLKKKYIVDYDDAIFHNYDRSTQFLVKGLLKNKIDNVMKNADVVIVGNEYLAKRALGAGAKRIEIIPTVIDLRKYQYQVNNNEDRIVVGWIGTKSTFDKHLVSIKDWLIKAQELLNIELHIIGITETNVFLGPHVKWIPWSEETEVADLSNIDIGIMPLINSPWEEGKCAYKIVQYLACGKPVIASNVGMNSELCVNGQTGFLADSEADFLDALQLLINDKELRKKMGMNGRALIEQKYNMQVTSKELIKILLE